MRRASAGLLALGAVALAVAAVPAPLRAQPVGAASAPTSSAPASSAPAVASPSAPPAALDVAATLRAANAAAQVGDWSRVDALTRALSPRNWKKPDRAELHRLRGLVAFFAGRLEEAEAEWLAYSRLELDAQLDPATVPPEAITYFGSVQAKHRAELRALRAPRPRRTRWLTLVPVAGQLQNGARGKAWLFAGALAALATTSVTSYLVVRRWCSDSDGTCDRDGVDHTGTAKTLVKVNVVSGIALVATYALGVLDAVTDFRNQTQLSPTFKEGEWGAVFVGRF
ncbi:MAG: hypothetical protein R3B48_11005 [Kofleriaceae bacterium]